MPYTARRLHLACSSPIPRPEVEEDRRPLAEFLAASGAVGQSDLARATALAARNDRPLAEVLLAHGWVSEADLMGALARQWDVQPVDLLRDLPDPRLIDRLGVEFCLRQGAIPWRRIGGALVIATARPDRFAALRVALPGDLGPVVMALAPERDIHAALLAQRRTALIREAETRVPPALSCRIRDEGRLSRLTLVLLAALAAGMLAVPQVVLALAFGWAVLTLVASAGLKAAAAWAEIRATAREGSGAGEAGQPPAPQPTSLRLPVVSVMVPLFHEADIAARLVRRLSRLDYPRELLDILLVVEQADTQTRAALAGASLPGWMRVVTVPDGPLRTKPRALNFALNFCRGAIVGIWDAEDAPAPDQIRAVVRHLGRAPAEVACLQGILDFYNPSHNWLTRCFAIEYAAWFRAMLPGLARLGLVVPLGGTTLFFRRAALESLGGWDAHNVTEDADLGLRLARAGWRTELIATVTEEEPNARALSWIRQRSRWIKGYAMTWGVHMRDPVALWRDLGARRFLAVQVLFLGSISQALLAPVLWSFWALAFGLPHPLGPWIAGWPAVVLSLCFVAAEALNIGVGLWATRGPAHRHLWPWVPTLHLYFPLAAAAAWKALHEVVTRPFYWDKTAHGLLDMPESGGAEAGLPGPGRMVPAGPRLHAAE